jgi:hypothetical protein
MADYRIVISLLSNLSVPRPSNNAARPQRGPSAGARRSGASGRVLIGVMRFKLIQLQIIILPIVRRCARNMQSGITTRCAVRKRNGCAFACVWASTGFHADGIPARPATILLPRMPRVICPLPLPPPSGRPAGEARDPDSFASDVRFRFTLDADPIRLVADAFGLFA